MDIDNAWFEPVIYSSTDSQQQTYVTKHDLQLLHKKIIATDLIVQKYQDANKALLRLQSENDDLKQQIEQITNECCIFGKQVTECTQECDNLKEQIEILNSEKRELHEQLRALQDENTNNYHEIMVLKQYESLKDINDQLTKTVDRQHKTITKLQLQLQRKSPVVYKPEKNKNEPSEKDIALTNSQKSVRELKLTLGRLVNFIQSSKIEIPTALHIRPVLKAYDINDDFLEIEGDFIVKPVKKVSKPVVSQTVVDDDDDDGDDDDNGDFIDVNHTAIQSQPVNTITPVVEVIEEVPKPSLRASTRQQQKKKEIPKAKPTKKRRQKDTSISENSSTKLDDLANKLEIALSQSDQQQISQQLSSFLSDDDEDKIDKSDKPQISMPIYTPIILQTPIIHQPINSSITIRRKSISNTISFLSDDDNDERLPTSSSPSVFTPILAPQQPTSNTSIRQQTTTSLHVDSITPMEIETSNKRTKYMSFLSEDDDDKSTPTTPVIEQPFINQEFISPLEVNDKLQSTIHLSTIDVIQPSLSVTEDSSLNVPVETISEHNNQDSLLKSSIPTDTLNSNHIDIVLRLLNFITQPSVPLKRLRLVRHRIQHKQIPEEQVAISTEDKTMRENIPTTVNELTRYSVPEPLESTEEINTIITDTPNSEVTEQLKFTEVSLPREEPSQVNEESNVMITETSDGEVSLPFAEPLKSTDECNTMITELTRDSAPEPLESTEEINPIIPDTSDSGITEQLKFTDESNTTVTEVLLPREEPSQVNEENNVMITETSDGEVSLPFTEPLKSTDESNKIVTQVPDTYAVLPIQEQSQSDEEGEIFENPVFVSMEEPLKSTESSTISLSQESTPSIKSKPTLVSKKPSTRAILETSTQSLLKPSQLSIIHRLLNILTQLPVKPLILPMPFPLKKRKQKSVVKKSSITLSRQPSIRTSRSPTRMQTRSLNTIRACIARCNQPKSVTPKKRQASEILSSLPSMNIKRRKTTKIEETNNEYDLIKKFLNSFSKEINDEFKKVLDHKLNEDISLFNDNLYEIINELMINKCDIILPLVKNLHPYEESIKILLSYINSKSSKFQQEFITKLNQSFQYETKQSQISNNRIKILNRLYFLTCSTCSSLSSVIIYARLFDIGYYFSHDILHDILRFISNLCSSLISTNHSSNILLHQILFDILQKKEINITLDYLENLLIGYYKYTHDSEDLLRCFILISRYQTWLWCSKELCSKLIFPLLNQMTEQSSQRKQILIILQHILFIYKDNEDFKQDIIFHDQIKQLFLSFKTLNSDECIVRDKIFFILHSCC